MHVGAAGRRRLTQRMKEDPQEEHEDENDQRGTKVLSQALRELLGIERHEVRHKEEEHRVDELRNRERAEPAEGRFEQPRALERGAHHHFKGRTCRTRNRETRPDRKVDEERKEKRKARVHARRKRREAARLRDGHDAENREAHGRHKKARKRGRHVGARLRAEKRRENQIPCTEKHGKQREADKQPLRKTKSG